MPKDIISPGEGKWEISIDDGVTFEELENAESVSVSMDQEKKEWTPFNKGGWKKSYVTGKSLSIKFDKKYMPTNNVDKSLIQIALVNDAYDHNYIAVKYTFPIVDSVNTKPAEFMVSGPISFTDLISSDSAEVTTLNFEISSNGKPTFTEEAA